MDLSARKRNKDIVHSTTNPLAGGSSDGGSYNDNQQCAIEEENEHRASPHDSDATLQLHFYMERSSSEGTYYSGGRRGALGNSILLSECASSSPNSLPWRHNPYHNRHNLVTRRSLGSTAQACDSLTGVAAAGGALGNGDGSSIACGRGRDGDEGEVAKTPLLSPYMKARQSGTPIVVSDFQGGEGADVNTGSSTATTNLTITTNSHSNNVRSRSHSCAHSHSFNASHHSAASSNGHHHSSRQLPHHYHRCYPPRETGCGGGGFMTALTTLSDAGLRAISGGPLLQFSSFSENRSSRHANSKDTASAPSSRLSFSTGGERWLANVDELLIGGTDEELFFSSYRASSSTGPSRVQNMNYGATAVAAGGTCGGAHNHSHTGTSFNDVGVLDPNTALLNDNNSNANHSVAVSESGRGRSFSYSGAYRNPTAEMGSDVFDSNSSIAACTTADAHVAEASPPKHHMPINSSDDNTGIVDSRSVNSRNAAEQSGGDGSGVEGGSFSGDANDRASFLYIPSTSYSSTSTSFSRKPEHQQRQSQSQLQSRCSLLMSHHPHLKSEMHSYDAAHVHHLRDILCDNSYRSQQHQHHHLQYQQHTVVDSAYPAAIHSAVSPPVMTSQHQSSQQQQHHHLQYQQHTVVDSAYPAAIHSAVSPLVMTSQHQNSQQQQQQYSQHCAPRQQLSYAEEHAAGRYGHENSSTHSNVADDIAVLERHELHRHSHVQRMPDGFLATVDSPPMPPLLSPPQHQQEQQQEEFQAFHYDSYHMQQQGQQVPPPPPLMSNAAAAAPQPLQHVISTYSQRLLPPPPSSSHLSPAVHTSSSSPSPAYQGPDTNVPASGDAMTSLGVEMEKEDTPLMVGGSTPTVSAAQLTEMLEAAQGEEVMCPRSWMFSLYDSDVSQHYTIASEHIAITRGAIKYLALYERYGAQTRFRFQLCKRYLSQRCSNGCECPYIHSCVLPSSTWVHINENSVSSTIANTIATVTATSSGGGAHGGALDLTKHNVSPITAEELAGGKNTMRYATMPPGVVFYVYPPNQSHSTPQQIPSEKILQTAGIGNVFLVLERIKQKKEAATAEGRSLTQAELQQQNMVLQNLRPRHCAHFQFKRMCNLGNLCNFVHSLVPFIQAASQDIVMNNDSSSSNTYDGNNNNGENENAELRGTNARDGGNIVATTTTQSATVGRAERGATTATPCVYAEDDHGRQEALPPPPPPPPFDYNSHSGGSGGNQFAYPVGQPIAMTSTAALPTLSGASPMPTGLMQPSQLSLAAPRGATWLSGSQRQPLPTPHNFLPHGQPNVQTQQVRESLPQRQSPAAYATAFGTVLGRRLDQQQQQRQQQPYYHHHHHHQQQQHYLRTPPQQAGAQPIHFAMAVSPITNGSSVTSPTPPLCYTSSVPMQQQQQLQQDTSTELFGSSESSTYFLVGVSPQSASLPHLSHHQRQLHQQQQHSQCATSGSNTAVNCENRMNISGTERHGTQDYTQNTLAGDSTMMTSGGGGDGRGASASALTPGHSSQGQPYQAAAASMYTPLSSFSAQPSPHSSLFISAPVNPTASIQLK